MHTLARPVPTRLAELVDATPPERDRYLDLLRALSIGVVAVGHWLLAVVRVGPDGVPTGTNALAEVPGLQRLTWLLQVMPLFFLVGGCVGARSWSSAVRRGVGPSRWITARLRRLAGPTAGFVGVWLAGAVLLRMLGVPSAAVTAGAGLVAVPLWFVSVYAVLVALLPTMHALHRRAGWGVPVALVLAAASVDVAHAAGVPLVGWLNFALVWLLPQQLGFLWADGRLDHRRSAVALAVGGLLALVVLTGPGGYPVSMVGVPGAARSNNAPPTVALTALTLWQLGVALLAAAPARRWLRRRRVWAAVIAVNARAMTLFLWHLTALVVVAATLVPLGWFGSAAPATPAWWASRPLWLLVLVLTLVPLVVVFGRFERPAGGPHDSGGGTAALVTTVALSTGAGLLATGGLDPMGASAATTAAGAAALFLAAVRLRRPGATATAHR